MPLHPTRTHHVEMVIVQVSAHSHAASHTDEMNESEILECICNRIAHMFGSTTDLVSSVSNVVVLLAVTDGAIIRRWYELCVLGLQFGVCILCSVLRFSYISCFYCQHSSSGFFSFTLAWYVQCPLCGIVTI